MPYEVEFEATLFTLPGKGGWTFTEVPADLAPPVTHGWGRTPVRATLDGFKWDTSVWREKSGRTLLPVSAAARRGRVHGDTVTIVIEFTSL